MLCEFVARFLSVVRHLIKLKSLDYRQFLDSNNPLAYALMAKMDYNRNERVRLKADFLRLILGCSIDAARRSLLVEFVETYLPLAEREEAEFQKIVHSNPEYAVVEQMITTYEMKGRKEGRMEGKMEGKKEGKKEGKQQDLILLLEKKFGKLDDAVKQRVRQIDSPRKLESLLLAVLDAQSLDDLPL